MLFGQVKILGKLLLIIKTQQNHNSSVSPKESKNSLKIFKDPLHSEPAKQYQIITKKKIKNNKLMSSFKPRPN